MNNKKELMCPQPEMGMCVEDKCAWFTNGRGCAVRCLAEDLDNLRRRGS
jgi:hypothetical protein